MKKSILLPLLLLSVLLASLTGCGSGGNGTVTDRENPTTAEHAAPAPGGIPMIENGAAIRFAYAEADRDTAAGAIELLRSGMAAAFGVTPEEPAAWQPSMAEEYSIVFGNTGDETAAALYGDLRIRGYAAAVSGKTVYVAAHTADAFAMAANAMLAHLKTIADSTGTGTRVILKTDYSLVYEGRYSLMNAQINGIELKTFEILRPDDSRLTEELARELSDRLTELYGYSLPVAAAAAKGKHYIRMEIDSALSPQHYGYRVENGELVIVSAGVHSMRLAVRAIGTVLRPDNTAKTLSLKNGDGQITDQLDNPDGLARPADSDVRVISANAMAGFSGWDSGSAAAGYPVSVRGEIFDSYLQIYDPDVVGLQEFCNEWHAYFAEHYANSPWTLVTGGGERPYFLNPILYRSDRFTLVSSGWENYPPSDSQAWGGRYMTWAVLQKNGASAPSVVVLNVHWTGEGKNLDQNHTQMLKTQEKLNELHSLYQCPVVVTGDFNTRDFIAELKGDATVPNSRISDTCYTELLADGTVKDAKFYCDNQINEIGDIHGFGSSSREHTWSYAHIFVSSDTTVRQFYTACDNDQEWLSDHGFLIADIDTTTVRTSR